MSLATPVLGLAEQLERIGGYVGLFSLLGVAALAILAFAQGRELKRLRDWAGTSPERLDALEERVETDLARGASRAGAPVRPPAATGTQAQPAGPGPRTVPAAAAGATAAAATTTGAPTGPPRPTPPSRPATAAGGGAGTAAGGPPRPVPPRGAAAGSRPVRDPDAPAPGQASQRLQGESGDGGRRAGAIAGVAVVGAVVVVGVLFAVGVLGGGGDTAVERENARVQEQRTSTEADTPLQRSRITVAVFNGTQQSGLAKGAGDRLEEARYRVSPVGDYTVGGARTAQGTSSVGYRSGQRRAAADVAERLGLPSGAVRTATADMRAAGRDADVIVILGADQADDGAASSGGADTGTGGSTGTEAPSDGGTVDGTGTDGTGTGTGDGTGTGTDLGTGATG